MGFHSMTGFIIIGPAFSFCYGAHCADREREGEEREIADIDLTDKDGSTLVQNKFLFTIKTFEQDETTQFRSFCTQIPEAS